jgi:glycerophosphoryl diester phosphodiesterase
MHPQSPRVLAHRGASGYELENTLAAFRRAVAMEADGIELDVHATSDGHLVVHHDAVVPAVGPIGRATMAELARHRLANGERIPSLEEALASAGDLAVWIEVKALPAAHDARLVSMLRAGPSPGRYGVHSFDHWLVRRIGEAAPELRTGILLVSRLIDPVSAMRAAGARVLWQEWQMIDEALIDAVHGNGGEVIAWTVNERAEAAKLAALGVDGLCGNYPDRLHVVGRMS